MYNRSVCVQLTLREQNKFGSVCFMGNQVCPKLCIFSLFWSVNKSLWERCELKKVEERIKNGVRKLILNLLLSDQLHFRFVIQILRSFGD